jgi:hypothetical protein
MGYFSRSVGGENSWAKRYFIQLKTMNEVAVLVQDITLRLRKLGIAATTGYSRVIWSDMEKPLVLKVRIFLKVLLCHVSLFRCFVHTKFWLESLKGRIPLGRHS